MKISVLSLVPNNNICCILVIYMQDSGLLLLTHRSHQFHFEVWAFLICLNRQESIRDIFGGHKKAAEETDHGIEQGIHHFIFQKASFVGQD